MDGQRLGSLIGAVFGLIYVLVNTGPLPAGAQIPLQVIGVLAFVAVMLQVGRGRGRRERRAGVGFGRGYWLVVAAEVVALAAAGAARAPIAVVSGVVPGALLLASGWWGARQASRLVTR